MSESTSAARELQVGGEMRAATKPLERDLAEESLELGEKRMNKKLEGEVDPQPIHLALLPGNPYIQQNFARDPQTQTTLTSNWDKRRPSPCSSPFLLPFANNQCPMRSVVTHNALTSYTADSVAQAAIDIASCYCRCNALSNALKRCCCIRITTKEGQSDIPRWRPYLFLMKAQL